MACRKKLCLFSPGRYPKETLAAARQARLSATENTMKVTLVADSTFLFEHNGLRILTDPWIGSTIYGGAWMQFPPPTIRPQDIGRLDFIFISHIHEDHCDPKTIAHLDRGATVILMDRQPNFVSRFLERHGFRFKRELTLKPFSRVEIAPGLAAEVIDADPAHELNHLIDSSLVLHWDRKALYFANDNPPYPGSSKYLQQYQFALALLPASGGSGYPACFASLSEADKLREKERIQRAYLDTFVETVETLRPRHFMASAGNHVIAGRYHAINAMMSFLPSPMFAYRYTREHLSAEAVRACAPLALSEGDCVDLENQPAGGEPAWDLAARGEESYRKRKAEFIQNVAARSEYDHDRTSVPSSVDWDTLFKASARNLLTASARSKLQPKSKLYIRLPSDSWGAIDVAGGIVDLLPAKAKLEEPYLSVTTDPSLLYAMLKGDFSWNIADASGYLTYARVPNVYDQQIVIALNHLREPRGPGKVVMEGIEA